MSDDDKWYYCMTHQATEHGPVCRAANRMGPYGTEEAAENWKSAHESREDTWDEQDEQWEQRPADPEA